MGRDAQLAVLIEGGWVDIVAERELVLRMAETQLCILHSAVTEANEWHNKWVT